MRIITIIKSNETATQVSGSALFVILSSFFFKYTKQNRNLKKKTTSPKD